MKKYTLDIFIDENDISYHEKADKLVTNDARLIVSVLEEVKIRISHEIIKIQHEFNLKKDPSNKYE